MVELLHLLVIVAVALAVAAGAGALALVAFRVSRGRQETAQVLYRATPAPPRSSPLPSEPRAAIEAPREQHIHFHGLDAETISAIIRSQQEDR